MQDTKQLREEMITFSRTENLNFDKDGGYFQFPNEEEARKFEVFLKLLEKQHNDELATQRKEILEEVEKIALLAFSKKHQNYGEFMKLLQKLLQLEK